jgi:ribosomal protein S18 acetylase RimI-like enzyme
VTITLRAMTQQEYDQRMPTLVREYADEEVKAGQVAAEDALEQAERENAQVLSDGLDTTGMLLFTAEVDGAPVGWLWLSLPGLDGRRPDTAWVYEVMIDPDQRGKGYGRELMLAAEQELTGRGVPRLGLNVFGDNTVARRLYESLGFAVTSQQMVKALTPAADG